MTPQLQTRPCTVAVNPAPSARPPLRAGTWVGLLIVVTFVLRLPAAAFVGLGYGESYYFTCAMSPELSYFDQPPLCHWLIWAAAKLGGTHPLVLRLPFLLLFAGTTWLLFALGRRLFSERAGLWAAALLNLSAVFTLSTALFLQPDAPLMFLMLACAYCLVRVLQPERDALPDNSRPQSTLRPQREEREEKSNTKAERTLSPHQPIPACPSILSAAIRNPQSTIRNSSQWFWWLLAGGLLGLAMLSKYHALFLVFGLGMFLLTDRSRRGWLLRPAPWAALLLALAVSSPVLIWNAQHGWISFLWQGARGTDARGLHWDWLGRNVLGQALWLLPWIWVPLAWQLVRCFRLAGRSAAHSLIAWCAVGPIVAFTAVSLWAPIGLHFHWQAPGYLLLLLALGESVAKALARGQRVVRGWLIASAAFTALAVAVLVSHAATGWWRTYGLAWWSDKIGQSTDPTLEMLDWRELEGALRARGLLGRPRTFYFTNRWFQTGKVGYALGGSAPVLCLHRRDPRALAFLHDQREWLGADAVLVSTEEFLGDPAAFAAGHFARVTPLGEVPIRRSGRVEIVLRLHLCEGFHTMYPVPYFAGEE